TCLIFGLAPALRATRIDLSTALKQDGKSSGGRKHRRLRNFLVVSSVTLALVPLVCGGMMVKSFVNLTKVDPGFRLDHVLTMQITIPESKYPEDGRLTAFYDQLLSRAQQLPGVKAAGVIDYLPLGRSANFMGFIISGR